MALHTDTMREEPGVYYKKVSVESSPSKWHDTAVSTVFPDLFDGKSESCVIKGGTDSQAYISEAIIPSPDEFGNSVLYGLKYFLYPTSIEFTDLNQFVPEFRLWNLKQGMGNHEGTLPPDIRDLTVFSAFMDTSEPSFGDNFSEGAAKMEKIRGTVVVSQGDPFLTLDVAFDKQSGWIDWTKEDLDTTYGADFQGERVIYIKVEGWKSNFLATKERVISWVWPLNHIAGSQVKTEYIWMPASGTNGLTWDASWRWADIKNSIKYTITSEKDFETSMPVTGGETIFTDIYMKGDGIYRELDASDFLMKARAEFSPDKVLTGGQSLKLHTKWHSEAVPDAENEQILHPPGRNADAINRQEVVCVYRMPNPQPVDSTGSSSKPEEDIKGWPSLAHNPASNKYHDNGLTGQYWSMDFNIEALDFCFEAGYPHGDSGELLGAFDNTAWLRGMAVCFSATKPRPEETFYDFVERCAGDLEQGNADYDKVAGDGLPVKEFDTVETFTGFFIGKYHWERGPEVGAHNNTSIKTFSKNPILCFPFKGSHSDFGSNTISPESGDHWRTSNIGGHSGSSGSDFDFFHEVHGPSVFYYPGNGRCSDRDYNTKSTCEAADETWTETDGANLSFSAIELLKDTWYKASILFRPSGFPVLRFRDAQTNEVWSTNVGLENPGYLETGPKDIDTRYFPRYVSIWLVNYPGGRNNLSGDGTPVDVSHGEEASPWTAENIVHIDNIGMWGFNNSIINASVNDNNYGTRGSIKMNPVYTFSSDFTVQQLLQDETQLEMKEAVQSNTYISIGFDNRSDFDKYGGLTNANYLFFSALKPGSGLFQPLHNNETGAHSTSDRYIRAGFTSNIGSPGGASGAANEQYGEKLGHQHSYYFFEPSVSQPSVLRRGLSVSGDANRGLGFTGNTAVESFNQKGMVKIDFSSRAVDWGNKYDNVTQGSSAKRENIFASARVIGMEEAASGRIMVDNPHIFNLPDDTEYVIYKRYMSGSEWFNVDFDTTPTSYYATTAKVIERDGEYITFDKDLRYSNFGLADGWGAMSGKNIDYYIKFGLHQLGMCHDAGGFAEENSPLGNIWVSPLKYWLVLEIFNNNGTPGETGVGRTYGSVATVNKGQAAFPTSSTYGTTWTEFLFTDSIINSNAWDLISKPSSSTVETSIDYGHGALDDKTEGGFVSKFLPKTADINIVVDATPIITNGKYNPGSTISTLVFPATQGNNTAMTIATSENTTNKKKPYLLVKYKDELPKVEEFEVIPDENNPFFPQFTWNCSDDDAWYGFIIIDRVVPKHQYHGAYLHVPMNRPIHSTENLTLLWPPDKDVDTEYGIFDYVNTNPVKHNYYGYIKVAHTQGTQTKLGYSSDYHLPQNSIDDEFTFLNPEGLSGWCHDFSNDDALYIDGHSSTDDGTTGDLFSCSVIVRPSSLPLLGKASIFETNDGDEGVRLYIDEDGYVYVDAMYTRTVLSASVTRTVTLKSHSVLVTDGTPTNIIVTFNKYLKHGNLKLFIDSKLEDISGRAYIDTPTATDNTTNWEWNQDIYSLNRNTARMIIGSGYKYGSYEGRMEELVLYNKVIYPIVPKEGKFTLTAPLEETDSDGRPISYFAKIFVKDYHNIRGMTSRDVATTGHAHVHKVGMGI